MEFLASEIRSCFVFDSRESVRSIRGVWYKFRPKSHIKLSLVQSKTKHHLHFCIVAMELLAAKRRSFPSLPSSLFFFLLLLLLLLIRCFRVEISFTFNWRKLSSINGHSSVVPHLPHFLKLHHFLWDAVWKGKMLYVCVCVHQANQTKTNPYNVFSMV